MTTSRSREAAAGTSPARSWTLVESRDDLATAYLEEPADIPVWCEAPRDGSRWRVVLDWHRDGQRHHDASGKAGSRNDDLDHWVATIPGGAVDPGEWLGRVLNRSVYSAQSLEALLGWARRQQPASLLMLLPMRNVSVHTFSHLWAELCTLHVEAGFLPADDPSELSFLIAKLCLAEASARSSVCTLDPIRRQITFPERTSGVALRDLRAAMADDWAAFTIHAHGDGTHLHSGQVVVCGVTGKERTLDGRTIAGGCALPRRCKRTSPEGREPIQLTSLRTTYLSLLSCTSIRLGHGYPSTVDLTRAASSSYPAVVAGTTVKTPVINDLANVISSLVATGWTAGAINQFCNEYAARSLRRGTFAVLGDPRWRIGGPDALASNPAAGTVRCETVRSDVDTAPVWGFATDARDRRAFFEGEGRICLWIDRGTPPATVDFADRLHEIGHHLHVVQTRFDDLPRMERAMIRATADVGKEHPARQGLAGIRKCRLTLEGRLAMARAACQRAVYHRVWDERIERYVGAVTEAVHSWDAALGNVVQALTFDPFIMGKYVYQSLAMELLAGPPTIGRDACEVCGNPLADLTHRGSRDSGGRSTIECAVCGPRESFPTGGARVRILEFRYSDQTASHTATVHVASPSLEVSTPGRLIVDVRGRTMDAVYFQLDKEVTAADEVVEVSFELPDQRPPDECRVQVAWLRELQIAYAHRSFHSAPPRGDATA